MNYSQKLPLISGHPNYKERQSVNNIIDGRTQNFGSVTATASTALTTVAEPALASDSTVILVPMDANARSEYLAGNGYVSAVRDGEFDLTHASTTTTRVYRYAWIG